MEFTSFFNINNAEVIPLYSEIIEKEWQLSNRNSWDDGIRNAEDIANVTRRIMEHATQALVSRIFNHDYGLSDDLIAFESDDAHVNLMRNILDSALAFKHRENPANIIPYYREIMVAAGRHDLPENFFGDSADNNSYDEKKKEANDNIYQNAYNDIEISYERIFDERVMRLLEEMVDAKTPYGRLLKCADKVVAPIRALCYDFHGFPPMISRHSEKASDLNREQMKICRHKARQRFFKGSELWTVDYLISRRFDLLDDTGFLTAVLIMATLMVNKKWYPWREKMYH